MSSLFKTLVPSAFGVLSIVWQETKKGPKVRRIFLPNEKTPSEYLVRMTLADTRRSSCQVIEALSESIRSFLEGEPIHFDLNLMAMEECSEFQKSVLLAEYGIPRGWVSTYGRIARSLGTPGAARAVGRALSRNPFPIIIPCHRAIGSDGSLGGYQGGPKMKRVLLEFEGVEFSPTGKVLSPRIYY